MIEHIYTKANQFNKALTLSLLSLFTTPFLAATPSPGATGATGTSLLPNSVTTFQGATADTYDSYALMSTNSIGTSQLQIFLNDGHDHFGTATGPNQTFTIPVGNNGYVVSGNFFGAGQQELVAIMSSATTPPYLFINDGNGGFTAGAYFHTNSSNINSGTYGVASGTFISPSAIPYPGNNHALAIINQSNQDLTVGYFGSYSDASNGTFQNFATVPLRASPSAVAGGHIVSSNLEDIVVTYGTTNQFEVFKFDGATGYTGAGLYSMATGLTSPSSIIVADLNNDGKADIAITLSGSSSVAVFVNTGNTGYGQTFIPSSANTYAVGANPMGIATYKTATGATGAPNLIVVNQAATTYHTLQNDGSGNFTVSSPTSLSSSGPTTISKFGKLQSGGVFNITTNYLGGTTSNVQH